MVSATTRRTDRPLPTHIGLLARLTHQAHIAVWERMVSSTTSTVQFGALSFLADNEGASQQELSQAMDLDRSTVAAIVQRLEREGLIQRDRDAADRRRNRVVLTGLGRKTREQLTPLVIAEEQALAGALSDEEKDQLRALLQKVLVHAAALRDLENDDGGHSSPSGS
jgi:DNA-binding MarR family transcriptional regulator